MDKYFKRKPAFPCPESEPTTNERNVREKRVEANVGDVRAEPEFDVAQLPSDPGLRIPIENYDVNIRDLVRRAYIQRGPCQPDLDEFPATTVGNRDRRFCVSWYTECPTWVEYSIAKDSVFCFYCYLFGDGRGSFVNGGYSNWKKKGGLKTHIAKSTSAHNRARAKFESFKDQRHNIHSSLARQSTQARKDYRIRLNASIDCVRFLLRQGMAFRGHDESEESKNQGNFLELLHWLSDHNVDVKVVSSKNAPENLKLTSPKIQKDIVSAIASTIVNVIIKDIGRDGLFSILVDESRDISVKEQMSVVFRYVKNGQVLEHFIGVTHVSSTTAISLKVAINQLFSRHSLSISNLRGQGYDGASNMRGEYNGLKTLILKENPSAHYIHCFAHQLQLALVAVAQKHSKIETFFTLVHKLVNVVGGSAKRSDILREKQRLKILEALSVGEIPSGQGLNQETTLKRPGDTRWGSHYGCLINLMTMFSSVVEVLEMIANDTTSIGTRGDACILVQLMLKFEFVFNLHLMKRILGISNELSKALQRKDQDIVNAMKLVNYSKLQLQTERDSGWDSFIAAMSSFCESHNINVPDMDEWFIPLGRSRREKVKNLHHYRVEMFYAIIDLQLTELNARFSELNSDLLICVASLCPNNSFVSFDKNKLIRLCGHYPLDFDAGNILELNDQLDTYILDMRMSVEFQGLQGLCELAQKLFTKNKHQVYPLVYKLLTLALILPVATATVERGFSAMSIVKSRLRNRIGDQWLNDSLIAYIEKDIYI